MAAVIVDFSRCLVLRAAAGKNTSTVHDLPMRTSKEKAKAKHQPKPITSPTRAFMSAPFN